MKKFTLFISIFILSQILIGQNWQLVKVDQNYFFDLSAGASNPHQKTVFTGFKVDSLSISNGDTTFLLSEHLQRSQLVTFQPCDTLVDTYFGSKIIKRVNETLILNSKADSIFFPQSFSNINSWKLLTKADSSYYEAQIIERDTMTFKSNLDSIIKYKVNYFNSQGVLDSNKAGDTLCLSKRFGHLRTYNWSDFPNDTLLLAYNQSNFELLSRREVFDFNVGNEIHYKRTVNNGPPDFKNIKVLQRQLNGNSISFIFDVKTENNTYNPNTWPPITTSYYFYQDTVQYDSLNSFIGGLPEHLIDSPFYLTANVMTSNNTDRFGYTVRNNIFYNQQFNAYCTTTPYTERTFIKGLGFVDFSYAYNGGNQTFDREQLIYYKKGSHTWGTPRVITGIDRKKASNKTLETYPIPTKNTLNITLTDESRYSSYQVMDLSGKVIRTEPFTAAIKVEDLSDGIYVLRIFGKDKTETIKFIKE
jgi:hypothetical protein